MQTYAEFQAADTILSGIKDEEPIEKKAVPVGFLDERFGCVVQTRCHSPSLSFTTLMADSPALDDLEAFINKVESFTTVKEIWNLERGLAQNADEVVSNLATICDIPMVGHVKRFLSLNSDLCEAAWDVARFASELSEIKSLRLEVSKDIDSSIERLCLNCFLDSDDMDLWDQVEDRILQSAFEKWATVNRTRMFVSLSHVDEL